MDVNITDSVSFNCTPVIGASLLYIIIALLVDCFNIILENFKGIYNAGC